MELFKQIAVYIILASFYVQRSTSIPPQYASLYRKFPGPDDLPEIEYHHPQFPIPFKLETTIQHNVFTKATAEISTGYDVKKPNKPFEDGQGEDTYNIFKLPTANPHENKNGDNIYVSSSTEAPLMEGTVNILETVSGDEDPKLRKPDEQVNENDRITAQSTSTPDEEKRGDNVYASSCTGEPPEKIIVYVCHKVTGNDDPKSKKPFEYDTNRDTFKAQSKISTPNENKNGENIYVSSSTERTDNVINQFAKGDDTISKKPLDNGNGNDIVIAQSTNSTPEEKKTGVNNYVAKFTQAILETVTENTPVRDSVYYYPKPIIPFEDGQIEDKYNIFKLPTASPHENKNGDNIYVSSSTEAPLMEGTVNILETVSGDEDPKLRKPDEQVDDNDKITSQSTSTPDEEKLGDNIYAFSCTGEPPEKIIVHVCHKVTGNDDPKSKKPFEYDTNRDAFKAQSTISTPNENKNGENIYVSSSTEQTDNVINHFAKGDDTISKKPLDNGNGNDKVIAQSTTSTPEEKKTGVNNYVAKFTQVILETVTENTPVGDSVYYYPKPVIPFEDEQGEDKYNIFKLPTANPHENKNGDNIYISSSTEAPLMEGTVNILETVSGDEDPKLRKPDEQVNDNDRITAQSTSTPDEEKRADNIYASACTGEPPEKIIVYVCHKVTGNDDPKSKKPFEYDTNRDTFKAQSTISTPNENKNGENIYVSSSTEQTDNVINQFANGDDISKKPLDNGNGNDKVIAQTTISIPNEIKVGENIYVSSSTEQTDIFNKQYAEGDDSISKKPLDDGNGNDVFMEQSTISTPNEKRIGDNIHISSYDEYSGYHYPKPSIPFEDGK